MSNQLVWFRNDLRVSDNAALSAAITSAKALGSEVFAVYIFSSDQLKSHGASTIKFAVIKTALQALEDTLSGLGIRLHIRLEPTWQEGAKNLAQFCIDNTISQVHCHYEPGYDERERDKCFKNRVGEQVKLHRYNDLNLLHPSQMLNKQGDFYKVFTAYKKALLPLLEQQLQAPISAPTAQAKPIKPNSIDLGVETDWDNPLRLAITESEAHDTLDDFLGQMPDYKEQRDFPATEGTSKLSVALSIGSISSRQIAWAIRQHGSFGFNNTYLSEIIWRDFYKYLAHFRTDLFLGKPFADKWDAFPWKPADNNFQNWCNGCTGVPIVDAAMRQLNQTGWMHNRLRMIVGMYLVKIMQVNWRLGEAYFAEKLADFDFAANNGGWQWVASTGVDAAPYFRIFNPYEQSRRFDPQGRFIRKFVIEINELDDKEIHRPAPMTAQLHNYPVSPVDYKTARADTLSKFKNLSVTS